MSRRGEASWYGQDFHGRRTANGEIFGAYYLTAASPVLPIPSYARVTNLENGRSVLVRINDRGPYMQGRVVDLSYRAGDGARLRQHGQRAGRDRAMSVRRRSTATTPGC